MTNVLFYFICCCCSVTNPCSTLCDPMECSTQASLSFTISWTLAQTHVHKVNDTIQPSHSLLPPSPPVLHRFQQQDLFIELALCIRWPKYWSFSISPSNEYSGLISFRMDWLDLPAIQGALMNLLQHHSSKASSLWCSAFFMVPLLHLCMTTGKIIALIVWTFVSKVMSLLFNTLSRFVIVFTS